MWNSAGPGTRLSILAVLFPAVALAATQIAAACEPIQGLDPLLAPRTVILLGEIHGNNEGPEFMRDVACHALAKKIPVTLALEIPLADRERLKVYLGSKGAGAERKLFMESPFWAKSYQDGRSSEAIWSVITWGRDRIAEGRPVDVILIDDPGAAGGRDRAMAANMLSAIKEDPERLFISLTGNLHNIVAKGSGRMGALLGENLATLEGMALHSLDLSHTGGTSWVCTSGRSEDCGILKLRGRDTSETRRVEIYPPEKRTRYTGTFHTGSITAAKPAARPD